MTPRPAINPPHAIYSARQRTVVLTFRTAAEAEAFDLLDDQDVARMVADAVAGKARR